METSLTLKMGRLYYQKLGAGYPLVFLHGWGGSKQVFEPLAKSLADAFTVYIIDLPGFGKSPPPTTTWNLCDYAHLIHEFGETLNLGTIGIIGHSFGGKIAIHLATRFPNSISHLVLIASGGNKRQISPHTQIWQLLLKKCATLVNGIGLTSVVAMGKSLLGSKDYKDAGVLRETLVNTLNEDLFPILHSIRMKTLLLWGERDNITPPANALLMQARICNSTLRIFKNVSHYPHLEVPEQVSKEIRTFCAISGSATPQT